MMAERLTSGFWRNNPGIVQLLGLCPLLAMSTSVIGGASLGIVTTLVLAASGLIVAVLVTLIQLAMNAYYYPLYVMLGIYVPLIATNCIVLARAELYAVRTAPGKALLDGIFMGLGLTLTLIVLGAFRELLGKGTLLAGIEKVAGESAKHWVVHVPRKDFGFLLAVLPPGAFIALGFLIALKNRLSRAYKN
jgi:Na+-translocating ferredoxin:NAD+ oxidoreductase subunit E